jgi:CoA:oxalate CoA-transferase
MWAITAIQHLPGFALTGQVPKRLGNGSVEVTPFNVYLAKDGYIVITILTIGQWQQFLHVIDRKDLLNVKEYTNQVERILHRHEIDALVSEWTSSRTVQEIETILCNNHLPCSPVLSLDKVVSDPQILDRNMLIEIEQMISGKIKVPGTVFKMTETQGDPTLQAPFLGQHNFEIFHDMLGLNGNEIEELTT